MISDPHANFSCFYSILRAGGVIDKKLNWTFGDGHLMICGDVMDRGNDATTIFWLIYKLEAEARKEKRTRAVMIQNGKAVLYTDKGNTGKEI